MSHFTVAVFTDSTTSVDELLAPYEEGTNDSMFLKWVPASESMEEITAKFNEKKDGSENLKQFVKRWYGYDYNPAYRNFGYICNPNAKWDWYEVGGRCNNHLRIKGNPDALCNEAQVCEIDFSINEDAYNKALRFWEVVVEGSPIYGYEREEDFRSFFNAKYYLEQYGTKENYAKSAASFSVWAFITPDGEWHENGAMGWFGFNDATQESRRSFAEELEKAIQEHPDCWLTMVDCHI